MLKIIFGIIFNHSPLFHISSDSQFGSFAWKEKWRISLFSLSLGINKYYLFTWYKGELKLYSKLELSNFLTSLDKKSATKKVNKYEKIITSKKFKNDNDKNALTRHQDYLNRRASDFENTYSNVLNKINNYTVICVAYLAFLSYLTSSLLDSWHNIEEVSIKTITIISFIYSIYYFLNTALFIRFSLKVKGAIHSSFSGIKNVTTDVDLAKASYLDWISIQNQVNDNVTILLNIEKYLYSSIFFSLINWLLLSFILNGQVEFSSDLNPSISSSQFFELVNCNGEINLDNISKVSSSFENKNLYYILYSTNNSLDDSIISFLNNFSANNSCPIIYKTARSDSSYKSIYILVKDIK